MHFPGFHVEAAKMLIEAGASRQSPSTRCRSIIGPSPDFAVHNAWLPAGRYGIEGVANLDALPASGATLDRRRAESARRHGRAGPHLRDGLAAA